MPDEEIIAFCGLVCTECPAYIATQTGNRKMIIKTARGWSTKDNKIDPDDIVCNGCLAIDKQQNVFCRSCKARSCGFERGVKNCSYCGEYPCNALEELWDIINTPEARQKLDWLRNSR